VANRELLSWTLDSLQIGVASLKSEEISKYLQMLGQELQKQQLTGEILIADEFVVLLDIGKPEISSIDAYLVGKEEIPKDISAYFRGQGDAIRKAAQDITERERIEDNWLDEALEGFIRLLSPQNKWIEYPGLRIYFSPLDYALALKVATADSSQDFEDINCLAQELDIHNIGDLFALITKYIPEQLLTPDMQLVVQQFSGA
jgi:hypothetical protein